MVCATQIGGSFLRHKTQNQILKPPEAISKLSSLGPHDSFYHLQTGSIGGNHCGKRIVLKIGRASDNKKQENELALQETRLLNLNSRL